MTLAEQIEDLRKRLEKMEVCSWYHSAPKDPEPEFCCQYKRYQEVGELPPGGTTYTICEKCLEGMSSGYERREED